MDVQRMKDELLLAGKPFYSSVNQGIANIPQRVGTGQQMLSMLMKQPEVKEAEIRDRGLHEIASRPKITREELQALAVQKPEPQVKPLELSQDRGETRYHDLQLPGGQNYRETLLTLPPKQPQMNYRVFAQGPVDQLPDVVDFDTREKAQAELMLRRAMQPHLEHNMMEFEKLPQDAETANYSSSHWHQPNVLAHIRHNDRTDAEGKKVLFVEEIQSDWGQEGKKKGFGQKLIAIPEKSADELLLEYGPRFNRGQRQWLENFISRYGSAQTDDQFDKLNEEYDHWLSKEKMPGVPTAPFVTNTDHWVNLALKHVIDKAVREGYDKVAFINGDQSADRYDLSRKVKSIKYFDRGGKYNVQIYPQGGIGWTNAGMPQWIDPDELENYVGKDLAKKITQGEGEVASPRDSTKFLHGVDLKVGGEGMKAFYDKIVPTAVKKLLPKVGGEQLGTVRIPNVRQTAVPMNSLQPGFDVTPAMRQRVLGKGLPLYAKGGRVPTMDQMRLKVWGKRSK